MLGRIQILLKCIFFLIVTFISHEFFSIFKIYLILYSASEESAMTYDGKDYILKILIN